MLKHVQVRVKFKQPTNICGWAKQLWVEDAISYELLIVCFVFSKDLIEADQSYEAKKIQATVSWTMFTQRNLTPTIVHIVRNTFVLPWLIENNIHLLL